MSTARMPACRETLRNISAYLDGELEPAACDTIERHSLGCPGCRSLVEGLRKTVGICRHGAQVELPDAVKSRARAAVRRLLDGTD